MQKLIFALCLSSLSLAGMAFDIQFIGGCSEESLLTKKVSYVKGMNVGDVSLKVLDDEGIPYHGTSAGLNQVFNTPLGLEAMEVISDNEMMAYGWCFEIDGKIPEVFADKVPVKATTKLISWFYGYAHFLNGEWISQCEKSYLRASAQICPN
jgi:hypothetical protein